MRVLSLILGIFLLIFSFMLLFQILFYRVIRPSGKPYSKFLISVFEFLEFKIARFISTFFLLLLIIYTILCIFKGNFKFGFRLFIFIPVYLIEEKNTYMNSLLFNSLLLMLCSLPCVHFVVQIF